MLVKVVTKIVDLCKSLLHERNDDLLTTVQLDL